MLQVNWDTAHNCSPKPTDSLLLSGFPTYYNSLTLNSYLLLPLLFHDWPENPTTNGKAKALAHCCQLRAHNNREDKDKHRLKTNKWVWSKNLVFKLILWNSVLFQMKQRCLCWPSSQASQKTSIYWDKKILHQPWALGTLQKQHRNLTNSRSSLYLEKF